MNAKNGKYGNNRIICQLKKALQMKIITKTLKN